MKEEEGADQLYENIVQLKLKAPDGKMRETDIADMQGIFHIIRRSHPLKQNHLKCSWQKSEKIKWI